MSHNTKTLHKHFENCQKEIERTNLETNKDVQRKNAKTGKYLWCLTELKVLPKIIIVPVGDNKDVDVRRTVRVSRSLINIIIKISVKL